MTNSIATRTRMLAAAVSLALLISLGVGVRGALAAAPGWFVSSETGPSNLPPGGRGKLKVFLTNIGNVASAGTVTLVDTLPAGVTATSFGYEAADAWTCSGTTVVTCTSEYSFAPEEVGEEANGVEIAVAVSSSAPEHGVNTARVSGGGAPRAAVETRPQIVSAAAPVFGIQDFQQMFVNEDGTPDTQAGSHPYKSISAYSLNLDTEEGSIAGIDMRDIEVDLPPGIIGDPHATPLCPRVVFEERLEKELPPCPADTQIGTIGISLTGFQLNAARIPVYNLTPPDGYPAQFGFAVGSDVGFIDVGVQEGANDAVKLFLRESPEIGVVRVALTFWGVPAAPSHTPYRYLEDSTRTDASTEGVERKPFLTLPTSCSGVQSFGVKASSWDNPTEEFSHVYSLLDPDDEPFEMSGCDTLEFNPSASVAPDTTKADTPAGLTTEVKVPEPGLTNPEGFSAADIQNTRVTLPAGVAINPGQAAGLVACQPPQAAVGVEGPVTCPAASKVGTVQIETPLLPDRLEGSVYILPANPPNLQLLIAASADGVLIKLVGDVHLDPLSGQLTTTFQGTPQLPFTNFKLSFSGGAQAALATPAQCGIYESTADFTPWSAPLELDAFSSSSFEIDEGSEGGACPSSPLPFTPSMIAGSTTDQAGGYTDFSLLLQRGEDQQRVESLQFKTPEGLLGMISAVTPCQEPAAAQGDCPASSQIGHTVVAAGPGPFPLVVPEPGQPPAPIYLTGPYEGAPYGLSIAVPVIAGPFNLGTVVVRARVAVDPYTTQLTITTGVLPTILDGVPTDLRTINAVIDRPGFMFNPTSCTPQYFSGTATSTEGATAPLTSHFQMGSCRSLEFKPDFLVSTSGKTSRVDGASLDAKIVYPTVPLGANQASQQSNIASVKVELPKQLPSRLTTLQKACPAATFEANPARCPVASLIGAVRASTPVLPGMLSGPVYFVSHGGEAFPSLIAVLQGGGVVVDLVGSTFISKRGITSSTFKSVPDVPISSFELYLPEGPYSALAANGNLCKDNLAMPTVFTAQDGAVIDQKTKITVTGCTKAKQKAKKAKKGKKTKKSKATRAQTVHRSASSTGRSS
jgi:uncharacterized repeat protein (TIGR01451 family)